jgi:aminoglycoside phosphotransferase (APT) family kinase protein
MMPVDDRGPWTLLDWQNVTVGNGLFDLCRFATLSMEPDERIANEADIVGNYVSQLNRAGVTYQYAAAWARYQELLPLSFAQQLRFFAGIESWDASRIAWRDAVAPRVIAALHQALG